ncbi:MAG TPA: sugar phosphate isomerase/epimerase family protein [Chloroflexota bacterium]|nr:sugar phosphate isomerase/epimerase family protein [Chloroflexota bacterium]
MKYAFTTLACPSWSIEQVVEAATTLGYDGVELRLLDGAVIDPGADRAKVEQAVARCRAAGVEVCALDSSCTFNHANPGARQREVSDLLRWIDLAEDLRVPLVRVFGGHARPLWPTGPLPDPGVTDVTPGSGSRAPRGMGLAPEPPEVVNDWVIEALSRAAPTAEQAGVTVVLETHDAFSSARRVAAVLDRVDSPRVAALWDSHHPYRTGETAQDVIDALGPRIAHVHVKDARRTTPDGSDWQLVLLGEGEVPVREQLQALDRQGYSGYVSVEWEKKWHPAIAEPEIALPQHIRWLRSGADARA